MKTLATSALLLALIPLAGCASGQRALVLEPVGPRPLVSSPALDGALVVFSALDPTAHFNSLPQEQFYTDYQVRSKEGALLEKVQNNPNPSVPGPAAVRLPAGEYRVVARANGYGQVTVPVVIVAHRTTTVHLEGDGGWGSRARAAAGNPVRLPDGQIVGWKADAQATAEAPSPAPPGQMRAHSSSGPLANRAELPPPQPRIP